MATKSEIVSAGFTVEKRKFTWKIDNFDMVRDSKEAIEELKFEFKAGESIGLETEWKFWMSVRNWREGDEMIPWIGIYLTCLTLPNNVQKVSANCRIFIQSTGNYAGFNRFFKRNYTEADVAYGTGQGYHAVMRKDANVEELPLVDGSLIVEMEVNLFAPAETTTTLNGTGFLVAEFERKFNKNLISDLGKHLNTSGDYSEGEIKIISKDKVEFGVSVGLLSARSRVFKAMLRTDMLEANKGVIRIDELSSKTISVLLRFIYTGTLHKDWSSPVVIVQLVYAADKYDLPDLVEFLDNVLGQVSTKETGAKLFNLAKKVGMKKAEKEIFEKMKREISSSDADDFMALISQCSESDILS